MIERVRRFDETSLGEVVPLALSSARSASLVDDLCASLTVWSGGAPIAVVSAANLNKGSVPDEVSAWVVARHLDGSRLADVQVNLNMAGKVGQAVVRLALA